MYILCDNEEQDTANCYENSATYGCVKSNSSCHKVSMSYTTQTVGTVRTVTFSQTVTNALSSVTQCNLIVLWAVSSGASAQTVLRPTAALPSGFWHHWIHSLTKLYTAAGSEIAVGLRVEPNFETGNGARICLCNVYALESTEAAVGLRKFHHTVPRVTTAWIEGVAWRNITFR